MEPTNKDVKEKNAAVAIKVAADYSEVEQAAEAVRRLCEGLERLDKLLAVERAVKTGRGHGLLSRENAGRLDELVGCVLDRAINTGHTITPAEAEVIMKLAFASNES